MGYAGERICCDADSHIMETFDFVTDYADPDIRPLIRPLALGGAGQLAENALKAAVEARAAHGGAIPAPQSVIDGPKGWSAYGAFDPVERSKALDNLGFRCQLVFPTFAATQFMFGKDRKINSDHKILYGGARALNRAMGEFCSRDRRLMGIAMVPLDNVELACQEIVNAAKFGLRAVWVPSMPAGDKSPGHLDLDPVWKTMCDKGLPFMLHIGAGSRSLLAAYNNTGQPKPTDWLGGGENLRVKDFMVLSFAAQTWLTAVLFDGVFNRFPMLRGGVIEHGAGFVPDFLRRLDMAQKMFVKTDPGVAAVDGLASQVMKDHVKFTPFPGENIGHLIRDAGDDAFLFSSDYPHPEGGKDPIGKFEHTMEGLGLEARERFYRKNFEHMMSMAA